MSDHPPVDVAEKGIDLAIVTEHAHRLCEGPLGSRVGAEAPVVDGETALEARVLG